MYAEDRLCPISVEVMKEAQKEDENIIKWIEQSHPTKVFEKKDLGDKELWAYKAKISKHEPLIYIPRGIREELTQWYHDSLRHLGAERLQVTMKQHLIGQV